MPYNWKLWFSAGDVLETSFRTKRFRIEKIGEDSLTVRLLDRNGQPTRRLLFSRLDALAQARKSVEVAAETTKLTTAVNDVWEAAGVGKDWQNESQYWAVVCERVRRRGRATQGETVFREGRKVLYTLSRSERNPKLRKACIREHGTQCKVCDFDFERQYGAVGAGFIHVHHLNPMADVRTARDVSVHDLVPVCANCHAMLHQRTPPFTPEELIALIIKAKR